jgi:hydroxymethylpyrimidine/phosphomethylpyrimidine kinase
MKVMDAHNLIGMGVITANTFQTEDKFLKTGWIPHKAIMEQLGLLLDTYSFVAIKIGIIESLEVLNEVLGIIRSKQPNTFIIWDPVLRASAGHQFHAGFDTGPLKTVLNTVNLVCPNQTEYSEMNIVPEDFSCQWFVTSVDGGDLYITGDTRRVYKTHKISEFEKHGSGCVLSSAIAANVARGYTLHKSFLRAKDYMYHFLNSSPGKLGKHRRS